MAASLLAIVASAACSLVLETNEDQCKVDGDCTARGGSFVGTKCVNRVCLAGDGGADADAGDGGPWDCLGHVTIPNPPTTNVAVTVPLIEIISKQPVTEVVARVCAKIDVNCTSPLSTAQPDVNGLLHLTIAAPFDGFVLLVPIIPDGGVPDAAPPDGGSNFVIPSLVFFNPPLYQDTLFPTVLLLTQSSLVQISQAEGTAIDPSLGAVFMVSVDCHAKPASGVTVSLDSTGAKTQGFYFSNDLPSLTASSTDSTGYAGFVNVPTGTRTVTGAVGTTQQYIGKVSVLSSASTISYTVLAPSP